MSISEGGREGKVKREGMGWEKREERQGRGVMEGEGRLASHTIFRPRLEGLV